MDAAAVRDRLRKACDKAGSQAAFASRARVSTELVRLVLSGQREPRGAILDTLGIELVRVAVYRKRGKRDGG